VLIPRCVVPQPVIRAQFSVSCCVADVMWARSVSALHPECSIRLARYLAREHALRYGLLRQPAGAGAGRWAPDLQARGHRGISLMTVIARCVESTIYLKREGSLYF